MESEMEGYEEQEGAWSGVRWTGQDSVDTEASPNSSRAGDKFEPGRS